MNVENEWKMSVIASETRYNIETEPVSVQYKECGVDGHTRPNHKDKA